MGIDPRDKRIGVAIVLATLATTAALTAAGTTQLLGHALLPLDDEGLGLLAAASATTSAQPLGAGLGGGRQLKDADPILCRNIFDSETNLCGGAPEVAENGTEPGPDDHVEEPIDPNAPPPPCDGSIRLVGSFYIPTHPDRSFAAIVDATGKAMLYREGMPVGQRAVERIGDQLVILRQASTRCSLSMFAPLVAAPPPQPQQVAAADTGSDDDGIPAADLDRGITKISDTDYAVTRGLLNEVLANQGAIMRVARVIPHTEGGQVVGLKLYGVRRNSLLSRIGLQNGDTLRTINGYSMASIDDGISAFANLRNADHLTVSVTRGGTPTNINYSIR